MSARHYFNAIFVFPSNSKIWFNVHLKRDAIRTTRRTSISIKFIQFRTNSAICGERVRTKLMRKYSKHAACVRLRIIFLWMDRIVHIAIASSHPFTSCITINWNLPQININTNIKREILVRCESMSSIWKGFARAMWCALGIVKSAIRRQSIYVTFRAMGEMPLKGCTHTHICDALDFNFVRRRSHKTQEHLTEWDNSIVIRFSLIYSLDTQFTDHNLYPGALCSRCTRCTPCHMHLEQ